ncbi:hypothetical protein [Cetobacterium sp. 2G large]|uniref:COG1470 family protein n=1 Tax=Cetobacterium sp. 2G large TaxID=2759680 RepID=UPI00163BF733|nr:hypothetical protein [Cetobacterium sp. 2G large]MBC2853639.1 hypothetical protein [Cetobacterium sp. 2G large]
MGLKNFLSIFFLITNFLFALQIGPPMFEQRIDGSGGYKEFTLKNSSKTTLRYKLTILPSSGKYMDMSKWTEVSPKIVTIKPGKIGKFKVFANAPKDVPEGEYAYTLSLKTMDLPKLPGETSVVQAGAKLNFDFHLEFIGYAGELKPEIELINPRVDINKDGNVVLNGTIVNKTKKRGIYCGITVISGNRTILSTDLRVPVNGKKDFSYVFNKDIKKSDVDGLTIRNMEDNKELLKIKIK